MGMPSTDHPDRLHLTTSLFLCRLDYTQGTADHAFVILRTTK